MILNSTCKSIVIFQNDSYFFTTQLSNIKLICVGTGVRVPLRENIPLGGNIEKVKFKLIKI